MARFHHDCSCGASRTIAGSTPAEEGKARSVRALDLYAFFLVRQSNLSQAQCRTSTLALYDQPAPASKPPGVLMPVSPRRGSTAVRVGRRGITASNASGGGASHSRVSGRSSEVRDA
jgi:hypothetical protein